MYVKDALFLTTWIVPQFLLNTVYFFSAEIWRTGNESGIVDEEEDCVCTSIESAIEDAETEDMLARR